MEDLPTITFKEFLATKKRSEDLKRDLEAEDVEWGADYTDKGFIYFDTAYIVEYEKDGRTRYHTILGNCNPSSEDLAEIERELFEYLPGLGYYNIAE